MENDSINENIPEEDKAPTRLEIIQSKKNLIMLIVGVLVLATLAIFGASKYLKPVRLETIEDGCRSGDRFSQTTGKPCQGGELPPTCLEGDLFNHETGEPCLE
ncbi:MAG: hypothetical protein WAV15_03090 [Minisyncoccia bacterium]